MAENFWRSHSSGSTNLTSIGAAIAIEASRQEQSCLYTSTTYYFWLRSIRYQRVFFVVTPIILGALATFSVFENLFPVWVTATLALLASLFPALATALKFETNVDTIALQAGGYKALQDRFRQLKEIDSKHNVEGAHDELHRLMEQLDDLRKSSLTAPDRYFRKAQKKISSGDYDFSVDGE